MLDFSRISHLLSAALLADKRVLQIGLGSGGAPVCQHLTMNGVSNWILYDHDTLQEVNLVKHPGRRSELNRLKVDIIKDWILDRNPAAQVDTRAEDVFEAKNLRSDIENCDLILCCPDKRAVRLFVNTLAVEQRKPCVTASVFRRGFGGEVYAYMPNYSGCFDCMDRVAVQLDMNINEKIEPTEDEKEKIYGLNLPDFQGSGLSLDIVSISLIQARMALDILTQGKPGYAKGANWIIHYNRDLPGDVRSGRLRTVHFRLRPQKECSCDTSKLLMQA